MATHRGAITVVVDTVVGGGAMDIEDVEINIGEVVVALQVKIRVVTMVLAGIKLKDRTLHLQIRDMAKVAMHNQDRQLQMAATHSSGHNMLSPHRLN
jgi:hypothetical protein